MLRAYSLINVKITISVLFACLKTFQNYAIISNYFFTLMQLIIVTLKFI